MADFEWLLSLVAVLAALAGFAWLALGMDAHWRQVHGHSPPRQGVRRRLRALGAAALVSSAALCFAANRPSMAILVSVMQLAATAPLIAFTLAWRPTALRWFWPAALPQ